MRKILASLLILIGLALPCAAQVAFDTSGISNACSAAGTSASYPNFMNVGSGGSSTNLVMVAFLMFSGANAGTSTNPSMMWNGTNMPFRSGPYANGTVGDIYIFGLVAPATGSHTLAASWTGSNTVNITALTASNADQTGGSTTFTNATSATGTSTSPQVAITNPSGQIAVAAYESAGNFTATGTGTDIGHQNACPFYADASNYSTSVNPTTSYSAGSGTWIAAGISIKSAGGASSDPQFTLMGVGQ